MNADATNLGDLVFVQVSRSPFLHFVVNSKTYNAIIKIPHADHVDLAKSRFILTVTPRGLE